MSWDSRPPHRCSMEGICRHRFAFGPWLPLTPLLEQSGFTVRDLERVGGKCRGQIQHWKRDGRVPLEQADELAVRVGLHPASVWGDLYWAVSEAAVERSEQVRKAG